MGCPDCPPREELVGLVLGYLPDAVLSKVAAHVDSCSLCEARIRELEGLTDTTLDALRHPIRAPGFLSEPQTDPSAPRDERMPTRLDEYRIIRELGRGGMGIVYVAEQESLGRLVALKVLPQHHACEEQRRERFFREARAAAQLHHSNIVPVFEIGQDHGVCYYTMQLIRGQGLDRILDQLRRLTQLEKQPTEAEEPLAGADPSLSPFPSSVLALSLLTGRFPSRETNALDVTKIAPNPSLVAAGSAKAAARPAVVLKAPRCEPPAVGSALVLPERGVYFRQVARLGKQAAEGLAYAHSQGLLHRDVKPSNLLLDQTGVLWITDFGLAKTQEATLTKTGTLMGTLRYLAPERFHGECDARSDLYSLGLTLYELLLFRAAFDSREEWQVVEQIKTREPTRPRAVDPRIPRDLETIVLKTIEKVPARRYLSAEALVQDLRRFLDDQPIQARRVSGLERSIRWARRNRGVAASLAVIAVSLVAAAVASVLVAARFQSIALERGQLVRQKEAERLKAVQATAKAVAAQKQAAAAQHLAEEQGEIAIRTLYFTKANASSSSLADPSGRSQLAPFLTTCRGLPVRDDPRGWEWFYSDTLINHGHRTLRGHLLDVLTVAWSRDGKYLASGGFDETIRIWDSVTGRQRGGFQVSWGTMGLCWSPDGTRLASANYDRTVQIWNPATGKASQTLVGHHAPVLTVRWSPDGKRLASADGKAEVIVWDASTGTPLLNLQGTAKGGASVSWSPDSKRLAASNQDYAIAIWDVAAQQALRTLRGHTARVYAVRWSPNGHKLASASTDGELRIWDAAGGTLLRTIPGSASGLREGTLSWSPDSRRLAQACQDLTIRIWDADSGNLVQTVAGRLGDQISALAWSPVESGCLATAHEGWNGEIKIWSVEQVPEPRTWVAGLGGRQIQIRWSPDGKQLATGHKDGSVKIWDAGTSRLLASLGSHTGETWAVCWRPDARQLASAGVDGVIRLWDLPAGRLAAVLPGDGYPVNALSWSRDGRRLSASTEKPTVTTWDTETARKLARVEGRGGKWSPRGNRLAVGRKYQILLYDANARRLLSAWLSPEQDNDHTTWSPDEKRIAAVTDNRVYVRNLDSGPFTFVTPTHPQGVRDLAWSPDGKRLATATGDDVIRLWDAATGNPIFTLRSHTGPIGSVAWSPDGLKLASYSRLGTIHIWDASPGYVHERAPALLPILDARLAAAPAKTEILRLRAGVNARLEKWDQAAADFQRSLKPGSNAGGSFFQAGWWIAQDTGSEGLPLPLRPDPFARTSHAPSDASPERAHPRWYCSADDPNGYLPLTQGLPYYLTRLYVPHEQRVRLRVAGAILPALWHNGEPVTYTGRTWITLHKGWNTFCARIQDGAKYAHALSRPRMGLFIRFTAPTRVPVSAPQAASGGR